MREISLHIADIIQNSVTAGASLVKLSIEENPSINRLKVVIEDNGKGMDKELLAIVSDPFVTSRTTRKVGLGISLFKSLCERCGGSLTIESELGKGTLVIAEMELNNIDRSPLGRIEDTVLSVFLIKDMDILFKFSKGDNSFLFDSKEIKEITGGDTETPEILNWVREYLTENLDDAGISRWY